MLTAVEFLTRERENLETLANFLLPESDLECGSLLGQKWHGTCCSSLPLWHLQRFSPLCFIYRTCRGPTCPPGNPRCVPHQRIIPLPPQLHHVASLVCFSHKVDSFDSWLLPVHYSCHSAPWFFFLLLEEPNILFLQRLTTPFIDHQRDPSWIPCLGHNMSIHLNISSSCFGAEPADILLYKSKKGNCYWKKKKKTFTNSLPAARVYDRAALSGLLFLSFSAVVVRRRVIILAASFLMQVRKKGHISFGNVSRRGTSVSLSMWWLLKWLLVCD